MSLSKKKKGLLLVAHGSKMGSANREVAGFAKTVRNKLNNTNAFAKISVCFLELARPSIPSAINFLVEANVQHIFIFPYFLAFGTHVSRDVPDIARSTLKQINTKRSFEGKPKISLSILLHLGKMPELADAVSEYVLNEQNAIHLK